MNNNKVGAVELMKNVTDKMQADEDSPENKTSTVEISISCTKLANKDVMSKSDPLCIIYNRALGSTEWKQILRTECIQNNLNPNFATRLTIDYIFEQTQHLRFEVYDVDNSDSVVDDEDLIGYSECTLANIVAAGGSGHQMTLDNSQSITFNGTICLVAEELASLKDEVFLRASGSQVGSMFSSCFNPRSFFTIAKSNEANNFVVVYRSEDIRGINPLWPSFTATTRSICNGDRERLLKLEVFKKNLKGEDDFVGSHFTCLKKMAQEKGSRIPLQNTKGQMIKTGIAIHSCLILPIFTFVEYIQAGTKIHLCFSIDFTTSNGDPLSPSSLHHISKDPTVTNPYEQAIESVGQVLKDYDNTGVFPVWGFGAKIPPKGLVSHEFSVTLEPTPNCKGVDGIIRAYRQCVGKVKLCGPTNFAPVINRVAAMASRSPPGQHYYVLVILTDGAITDLPLTKEAIVNASVFPISIIIVGVGDEDFSSMEELDGDEGVVTYMGKQAERDIVQFIEFRNAQSWLNKCSKNNNGMAGEKDNTNTLAKAKLAEEILAEIPGQLTGYMRDRGIDPSMITKDDSGPELIYAGASGPDVAASFEKMKKLVSKRKKLRKREEEKRIEEEILIQKKLDKSFSLLGLLGKGKLKFWKKSVDLSKAVEAAKSIDTESVADPNEYSDLTPVINSEQLPPPPQVVVNKDETEEGTSP